MISNKIFQLGALATVVGLTAHADTIQASLFSPSPVSPPVTAIALQTIVPPSQAAIAGLGYTVTFSTDPDQGVVQGFLNNKHAVPVSGVFMGNPLYLTGDYGSPETDDITKSGNYFSTGLGTITIKFDTPQTSLALLWGSIDPGNSLKFNNSTNYTVTGSAVAAAAAGFVGNGFQGPGGSAWVLITPTGSFTEVVATSSFVSFEFAALAGGEFRTVPEPGSMMLSAAGAGFFGLALFLRNRRQAKA